MYWVNIRQHRLWVGDRGLGLGVCTCVRFCVLCVASWWNVSCCVSDPYIEHFVVFVSGTWNIFVWLVSRIQHVLFCQCSVKGGRCLPDIGCSIYSWLQHLFFCLYACSCLCVCVLGGGGLVQPRNVYGLVWLSTVMCLVLSIWKADVQLPTKAPTHTKVTQVNN